jgi:hypothetical protein
MHWRGKEKTLAVGLEYIDILGTQYSLKKQKRIEKDRKVFLSCPSLR